MQTCAKTWTWVRMISASLFSFHTHTLSSRTNSTHTPPHKKKKKKKYRYHSFSALNDFALSWATSQARKECTTPSKSSLMSSDDSKQIFPWHTPTEHAPLKSRPSTEWGCYFYALSNVSGGDTSERGGADSEQCWNGNGSRLLVD